jgi:hypothetical protein
MNKSCWRCDKFIDPYDYTRIGLCTSCTYTFDKGIETVGKIAGFLLVSAVFMSGYLYIWPLRPEDDPLARVVLSAFAGLMTTFFLWFALWITDLPTNLSKVIASRWWSLPFHVIKSLNNRAVSVVVQQFDALETKRNLPKKIEAQQLSPIEYDNLLTEEYKKKRGWE